MGNIHLTGSFFAVIWLCLPYLGHCQVIVSEITSSPPQLIENGKVTLTCLATGFEPDVHDFTWQRSANSSYVDITADDRNSFSPANLVAGIVKLYSQTLTITNLTKSNEGLYLCVIVTKADGNIIANGEFRLTVNSTEEFSVCFPNGPAVVNEGDILTCRTVINERTPVVSGSNDPVERKDFVNTSLAVNETGSQLQKSALVSDDGVTFYCFSIIPRNQNWTSLSCKMGPLTVIPDPLTTPTTPQTTGTLEMVLPIVAIIGIAEGAFLLLLLLLLLIHTICCRCKVKRWLTTKSYLLNFDGFFSGTIRRTQPRDPNQTEVELGRQNPDGSEEPYPASDDQVRIIFDSDDDPDVLPTPKSEPNIYEGQTNPGTSSQRETDPEEDACWNENLKQQLADAVDDDEDDFSD